MNTITSGDFSIITRTGDDKMRRQMQPLHLNKQPFGMDKHMFKSIIIFGVLSGLAIVATFSISTFVGYESEQMAILEWMGYLIMIVALSLIFLGVKRIRDNDLGGVISFLTALKAGVGIAAVAGVIYVVGWEANLAATGNQFIEEYTQSIIEQRQAEGLSEEEMQAVYTEMEEMKTQYNKTLPRLFMTFLEIFPVGLLIALISAAILRRSEVLPAQST